MKVSWVTAQPELGGMRGEGGVDKAVSFFEDVLCSFWFKKQTQIETGKNNNNNNKKNLGLQPEQ